MKKIFLILIICLAGWKNLPAQCQCDFQVELVQDPNNLCCFDLLFCNNGGPACNFAAIYGPLTIFTNGNVGATASIASATSANTSVVTAALQGSYQAVFTSNFTALGVGCNPKFNVGTICLDSAPNSAVSFSAVIFQPGGNPCDIPLTTSQFMVPSACALPAGLFEKYCGDDFDNRPTAIKAFGDGVYVSGYNASTNQEHGTFKKYDLLNGTLKWQVQLNTQSRIVDFEYDPTNDEFLLVGWTSPLSSTVDNQSLLLKIDDNGNLVGPASNAFSQFGREGFTRIILHPHPADQNFPYYVLGRKNTVATPSSDDVVVVYNVNEQGSIKANWPIEFNSGLTSPTDDEFFLGVIPKSNGGLLLTGPVINNDGMLVEINGLTGAASGYRFFGQALDIYDGIEIGPDRYAVVGENWATHRAFVAVLQKGPVNGGPIGYSAPHGNTPILEFPNIFNFKDIWADQYGQLYVIGENKNTVIGKNYQVVHKLTYSTHAGSADLSVDWAKYLEDLLFTETNYANGVISVTPAHDRIFYADSRMKVIPFFGDRDMLAGSYDLNFLSSCEFPFPFPTNPLVLTADSIFVSSSISQFTALNPPQLQHPTECCTDIWVGSPCTAALTYVLKDCFKVDFTASSSSCIMGNYTYDWDFDGDTLIDATTNTPTISHTFPCGGGVFTVCVTVTDPLGCAATVCDTINVNNCQGCIIPTPSLTCNPNDFDAFDFSISLTHMIAFTSCNYTVTSLTPGVVLSINPPTLTNITGTATVTTWPTPTVLNLNIAANCVCPAGGAYVCNVPVSIPTICCKEVDIPLPIVCEEDSTFDVQIQPFGTLCSLTQVTWYMQPKPPGGSCPTSYWGGKPYQDNLTNVLEPLHLYPAQMSGDVCVYAVVQMNDGPCTKDTTNIACVQLCAPTTCTLQNDQDSCYMGTPITPAPFTLTLNSPPNACFPSIQWFAPDSSLVQQGGTTYTPTQQLSMSNPTVDCYEDFFYTVKITDLCGTRECKARVRLYSDDAPKGTLQVLPYEANTLCPYEDVTLNFTPGCDSFNVADPKTWTWHTRPCDPSGACTPVQGSGVMSDNWFTNMLQTSTYYYVETQNGVCPVDSVQLFLEVKEPLSIILFDAIPDPCVEQQVDLSISWNPCTLAGCLPGTPCSTQCSHTVEWYKDCTQIGITNEPSGATTSMFTYTSLPLAGNYYAVVKDDCCPNNQVTSQLVTILPTCEPVIAGPCFICENEQVTLKDMSIIPPSTPCPYFCGWTWTTSDGNIISNPLNVDSIVVDAAGTYTLITSCVVNGQVCVKDTSITLIKCQRAISGVQDCGIVAVEELLPPGASPVRVFPNPTSTGITIEWDKGASKNAMLFITNAAGQLLLEQDIPFNATQLSADLDGLVPGLYFIKIQAEGKLYEAAKVVKQ